MSDVTQEPQAADTPTYKDDDLVYVDPEARAVVGLVQFLPNGNSKPLAMQKPTEEVDDDEPKVVEKPTKGKPGGRPVRKPRVRYYPWGTYRSMKKIYKIEGKIHNEPPTATLDEIMEKALKEPYWD